MRGQKPLNLDQALKELKDLIYAIHKAPASDDPLRATPIEEPSFYFSISPYGGVELTNEDFRKYRRILDALCAITSRTVISRKAIDKKLQAVILKTIDINAREVERSIEKRRKSFFRELQDYISPASLRSGTIHIRVAGLDASALPMSFGGITFRVFNHTVLEEHKRQYENLETREEYKKLYRTLIKEDVEDKLMGDIIAIVPAIATDNEARVLQALVKLGTVVDAMNFYSDILHHPGWARVAIFSNNTTLEPIFGLVDPASYSYNPRRVGPQEEFSIKQLLEGRGKEVGSNRLDTLLQEANPNSLSERIIAAIRWSGRATVTEKLEEAFLLYAIALESLIMEKGKTDQVVQRLTTRGAAILSLKAEDTKNNRKELSYLYGIRSRIAHEGSFEVSDADLRVMRNYTKEIIYRVMAKEPFVSMQNEEELFAWFGVNAPIPDSSIGSDPLGQ